LGPVEVVGDRGCQWLALRATKVNRQQFTVWVLGSALPSQRLGQTVATTTRYLLQEGDDPPQEFAHRCTRAPVLPTLGAWDYLWPQPAEGDFRSGIRASEVRWLGHRYELETTNRAEMPLAPPRARRLDLLPDVLVGVPSNSMPRCRRARRRSSGKACAPAPTSTSARWFFRSGTSTRGKP
jgi:hypothetical protein